MHVEDKLSYMYTGWLQQMVPVLVVMLIGLGVSVGESQHAHVLRSPARENALKMVASWIE